MVAYEVFLNGERLCLAGIDGDGGLVAILSYARGERRGERIDHLDFHVSGSHRATKEQSIWTHTDLKTGDEVRLRIVDVGSVHPPETREAMPEYDPETEKAHVRWWAKKLGWTLIEGPAPEAS